MLLMKPVKENHRMWKREKEKERFLQSEKKGELLFLCVFYDPKPKQLCSSHLCVLNKIASKKKKNNFLNGLSWNQLTCKLDSLILILIHRKFTDSIQMFLLLGHKCNSMLIFWWNTIKTIKYEIRYQKWSRIKWLNRNLYNISLQSTLKTTTWKVERKILKSEAPSKTMSLNEFIVMLIEILWLFNSKLQLKSRKHFLF